MNNNKKFDSQIYIAIRLHINQDLIRAKEAYKKILKFSPRNFNALHLLGVLEFENNNYEEAISLIKKSIEINPVFSEAHYNLANVQIALGQIENARKSYLQAINLKKDYSDAYLNLGNCELKLGDTLSAEANFLQSLKYNPNSSNAYYNLGNLLKNSGRKHEAENAYSKAIEKNPKNTDAHRNLGNLKINSRRFLEAIDHYKKAIENGADVKEIYSALGLAYAHCQNPILSRINIEKSLEILPHTVLTLTNKALSERLLGEMSSLVEELFEKAIMVDPNYSNALSGLGRVLIDQNKLDQALSCYQKSYDLEKASFGLEDGVYTAVISYLKGEILQAKTILENLSEGISQNIEANNNAKGYWEFLSKLVNTYVPLDFNSKPDILYVIGESHSLSYHHVEVSIEETRFKSLAKWIPGCKQWHLANSKPNHYKRAFENIVSSIPRGSNILLVIGEIDCRVNEGIIPFMRKQTGIPLKNIVSFTINGYLAYTSEIIRHFDHKITVAGIPAPIKNISSDAADDTELLIRVRREFNDVLKIRCKDYGFNFLDVYGLTNCGDGSANLESYIDSIHLHPNAIRKSFNDILY